MRGWKYLPTYSINRQFYPMSNIGIASIWSQKCMDDNEIFLMGSPCLLSGDQIEICSPMLVTWENLQDPRGLRGRPRRPVRVRVQTEGAGEVGCLLLQLKIYSKNKGRRGTSPSLSSSWPGLPGLAFKAMIISSFKNERMMLTTWNDIDIRSVSCNENRRWY